MVTGSCVESAAQQAFAPEGSTELAEVCLPLGFSEVIRQRRHLQVLRVLLARQRVKLERWVAWDYLDKGLATNFHRECFVLHNLSSEVIRESDASL